MTEVVPMVEFHRQLNQLMQAQVGESEDSKLKQLILISVLVEKLNLVTLQELHPDKHLY